MARLKALDLPGIWEDLSALFPDSILAYTLGIRTEHLYQVAQNRMVLAPASVDTLEDLCALHGITPKIYVHAEWDDPKGVFICSTPQGWQAWHISRGWPGAPRYIGSPEALKHPDDLLLAQARLAGWPW